MCKFAKTYCSQCGGEFGPGDHGFSHCDHHRAIAKALDIFALRNAGAIMFEGRWMWRDDVRRDTELAKRFVEFNRYCIMQSANTLGE